MSVTRKIFKGIGISILVPIVLVLILVIAIYLPPVQRWAVKQVSTALTEKMGLSVTIGDVRLTPFLDLRANNLLATDTEGDTIVAANTLLLNVAFAPLFDGQADINGFELAGATVHTKSLISNFEISGKVGRLAAEAHGVAWKAERVRIDQATLNDADLCVTLSDTAKEDSVKQPTKWLIDVDAARIKNTALRLSMPGDTMHLKTHLGEAALDRGRFNLGEADYRFQRLILTNGAAQMNTTRQPLPQNALFDLKKVALRIDTLHYDRNGKLNATLHQLSGREGLRDLTIASGQGKIYLDKERLRLSPLQLLTAQSRMTTSLDMEWDALSGKRGTGLTAKVSGSFQPNELLNAARGAMKEKDLRKLQEQLQNVLNGRAVLVDATARGNLQNLSLEQVEVEVPGMASLTARGYLKAVTTARREGHLNFRINTFDLRHIEQLLPVSARQTLKFPRQMAAMGTIGFHGNDYRTRLQLREDAGIMMAQAAMDLDTEAYEATAQLRHFPLQHFLKGYPLTPFTGKIGAQGQGFDPIALRSNLTAKADIQQFSYDKYPLHGIQLSTRMKGGDAVVNFTAKNPLLRGKGEVVAHLLRGYNADIDADIDHIDLKKLGATQDSLAFGAKFKGNFRSSKDFKRLAAAGKVSNIRFITPLKGYMARDIDFAVKSAPDSTTTNIVAGDLDLQLAAAGNWERISQKANRLMALAKHQIETRSIDQSALKTALPDLTLHLRAGNQNPIAGFLHYKHYEVASVALDLQSHPQKGLNGFAAVGQLQSGNLLIDTIYSKIVQEDDGIKLYATAFNNKKTNPNPFSAKVKSYLLEKGIGAEMVFADGDGRTGLSIGTRAEMEDNGVQLSLYPEHPVVAYRNFTINPENFIFLGKDKTIKANVDLVADDGTGLQIYSDGNDVTKNDITISLHHLNLKELSNVFPYLPKMGGTLNGDFHLIDDHEKISAMGTIEAQDFTYSNVKLGTVGSELVYMPKEGNEHYADAFITFNGEEVAECRGSYFNVDEGKFEGDVELKEFPMQFINGFLEDTGFGMSGTANGKFSMSGSLNAPKMDGRIDMNKAHLYSKVYGIDFVLDEQPVVFNSSKLEFNNYKLRSSGQNALTVNGKVDMTNLNAIALNFDMKAKNFALINAKRQSESLVYGKLMADFEGSVKGDLNRMLIRGNLDVLGTTNVTYLLANSPLSVKDDLERLVTFKDFSDTLVAKKIEAPSSSSAFDLALGIHLSSGAKCHCLLSNNGESYVNVAGSGNLTFRMTPNGEMRMVGRYTIEEGKMNYELPVIPLRTFTLAEGSYVEFTGNVTNPRLNIVASDRVKATVTEDDRQRAVNFITGIEITRTLEDMGLAFTIEAPEDLYIQNQLTAMSQEDRNKAAVALLATGMYVTDDNLANGGLKASNALNAFLQNEIQNIAGRALSTVDLSFGLENGTSATGATTVDYSFQFSKRFLNDRMRVVIGGKVSTSNEATQNTQSFIDNIALEYRLDASGKRYVRIFYDRDSHDPLEGALMKTGLGLVLRRQSDKLGDLFLFRRSKRQDNNSEDKVK